MKPEPPNAEDPAIREAKVAVRRRMRAVLGRIGHDEARAASAALCRRLAALEAWSDAGCLLVFLPMAGEPDIEAAAEAAAAAGRRICVPRVDWDHRRMEPVAIAGFAEAVPDPDHPGLRSPAAGPPVDPASIDLVLVPGLAFDAHGRRLGRGGGFYDRFLPTLRPGAMRVGVGFDAQILPEVPADERDIRMSLVLSESRSLAASPSPR